MQNLFDSVSNWIRYRSDLDFFTHEENETLTVKSPQFSLILLDYDLGFSLHFEDFLEGNELLIECEEFKFDIVISEGVVINQSNAIMGNIQLGNPIACLQAFMASR